MNNFNKPFSRVTDWLDKLLCTLNVHEWGPYYQGDDANKCLFTRRCLRPGCGGVSQLISHEERIWVYEFPNSCNQVNRCPRCGDTEGQTRVQHEPNQWQFKSRNSCEESEMCPRCRNVTNTRTRHNYGDLENCKNETREAYSSVIRQIYKVYKERFSISELDEVCFELGINSEDLPSREKREFARAIILEADRRKKLPELLLIGKSERPDIHWEDIRLLNDRGWETIGNMNINLISLEIDPVETCHMIQICKKCGDKKTIEKHRWGKEDYQSTIRCNLVHICERCGISESVGDHHEWELPERMASKCKEIKRCRRCGIVEIGESLPHDWGSWDFESVRSCRKYRACHHCGEKEFILEQDIIHEWGEQQTFMGEGGVFYQKQCKKCGATEPLYPQYTSPSPSLPTSQPTLRFPEVTFPPLVTDNEIQKMIDDMLKGAKSD